MIEIPESLVLAEQLNKTVNGKKIVSVETEHTEHKFAWYEGDPQKYDEKMAGQVIGRCTGIGSMVEMEVGEYSFVAGDGTNIRYYDAGEKLPERYQTRIVFEDGSSLLYTVQMYGSMFLIIPQKYENPYYLAAKQKPMPGTEVFDYPYFCTLAQGLSKGTSAKAFLATEQRIPGLGNGVLQDILLESGIHPKRKILTLSDEDFMRLYDTTVRLLTEMKNTGGRNTEKTLFGEAGGYETKLSRKNIGYCPHCGGPITKMAYLGGTVYFCSTCQPLD